MALLAGLLLVGLSLLAPDSAHAQATATPEITSPVPGSVLPAATATFTVDISGVAIESSWYFVGSTPGGTEFAQVHAGTGTTQTVTGLPTDGSTVYVSYIYRVNGEWATVQKTYLAAGSDPVTIVSPSAAILPGSTATFTVDLGGRSIESSWYRVGSIPGGNDYAEVHVGTGTTTTITGLPTDNTAVHVTYLYRVAGEWSQVTRQYYAYNGPRISQPVTSAPLPGATVTFDIFLAGTPIESSWLFVGSTVGGNEYGQFRLGTATSHTFTNLPTDGSTVHATYFHKAQGVWYSQSETYVAAGSPLPQIVSPAPGSVLPGPSATVVIDLNGLNLQNAWMRVGSMQGSQEYGYFPVGTNTTIAVDNLPTDGSPVWIGYVYQSNNTWAEFHEPFTAASVL